MLLSEAQQLNWLYDLYQLGQANPIGYLKRFPFDNLKIDKAFINDIPSNEEDESLVLTIITLTHNFKLKVIAEVVETRKQVDFLILKNCDEIQGYFFSRPLPAMEVEQLFNKRLLSGVFL